MTIIGAKQNEFWYRPKSGHVKSGDIRDMVTEGLKAGFYHSREWNTDYPRIQTLTSEELLKGAGIKMAGNQFGTFKQAQRVQQEISPEGAELELYTG